MSKIKKQFNPLTKLSILIAIIIVPIFSYTIFTVFGGVSINKTLTTNPDLNSGLVGHWTFDGKDMNPNVRDISGQGNHGNLSGQTSTTTVIGKIGQALDFDGVDDYVDVGTGPTTVNTVAFWVYPETATEYFVNLTGTTDYVWLNVGTIIATGVTSPIIYVDGAVSSTLVTNQWQHVVITSVTSENASNLDIGRTADSNYLQGIIDDVRIYNRTLSAEEITRLYNLSR